MAKSRTVGPGGVVEPVAPMEMAEFEAIRLQLGKDGRPVPYAELARALGYADPSPLFKWRKENRLVPGPTAKLMRVFANLGFIV